MAEHAAENFHDVDAEHFKNHLDDAMGDLGGELESWSIIWRGDNGQFGVGA